MNFIFMYDSEGANGLNGADVIIYYGADVIIFQGRGCYHF